MRLGVVLMNLGGPTSEESVRTFLFNLFSDTDIIKLGGGKLQNLLATTISKFRAPKVALSYKEINACPKGCTGNKYCLNRINNEVSNCCSPINPLTEQQRKALEKSLLATLPGTFVKAYTAMRYWRPFADVIIEEMKDDGITHVVLLPLYPQFSWTTTGSSFRDWETQTKSQFGEEKPWREYYIKNYHLNKTYLASINQRIEESLSELDSQIRREIHLVFSAHGTPVSEVESGDPYTKQIEETVEAVMELRGRKEQYWLSYQSRVGPAKWTQPNTEKHIFRMLEYGIKHILMIPVAFVTDHIETLMELKTELPEAIEERGLHIHTLKITKGLNDSELFINALKEEVLQQVSHLINEEQHNESLAG
ncbi:MAG: ferrochelatase [Bacteroidetes bacterium]|nr:ferrochelatase [Bacteroidota bacterium]